MLNIVDNYIIKYNIKKYWYIVYCDNIFCYDYYWVLWYGIFGIIMIFWILLGLIVFFIGD